MARDYVSIAGLGNQRSSYGRGSWTRSWTRMTSLQRLAIFVVAALVFMVLMTKANGDSDSFPSAPLPSDLQEQALDTHAKSRQALVQDDQAQFKQEMQAAVNRLETENANIKALIEQERNAVGQEQQLAKDMASYKQQMEDMQRQGQELAAARLQQQAAEPDVVANIAQPQAQAAAQAYGPKNAKQQAVVDTFKWAWKGYRDSAWGHDELLPVSQKHSEWFHLGLTLVDALDTMYLMGLKDDFKEARDWVANDLQLDQNVDVNLFECTIRVLGGLLSTYALSNDKMFLDKAVDLGDRLMYAFNDASGVPYSDVNLKSHQAHKPKWGPDSSTSEVSTIQLEFKLLSHYTKDRKYHDKVTTVMKHLNSIVPSNGLVPIFINANTGRFSGNTITLGARGDSYYEYLLKQWLQTNKEEELYRTMYVQAVNGIRSELITKTDQGLTYVAELLGHRKSPKMDHLVCFLPGLLALGSINGMPQDHLELAKDLTKTCYEMYARQPAKLAPEIAHFNDHESNDMYVKPADAHNLLRPETVESLFIMWRITKDPIYREWGWNIYQAFEKHCRVASGGYSSLKSVLTEHPQFRDKMESFFLGETLKYLYLLFEDDDSVVALDKWVINTEAHPLPIFSLET